MTTFRLAVVCAGNICRSPIAEVVLNQRLADAGLDTSVVVDSAGTGGWHVGEPADSRAVRVLARNGYDGSRHRARRFALSWFASHDLILALDSINANDLRRIAPAGALDRIRLLREFAPDHRPDSGGLDVPDPYTGTEADFEHVLELVEEAAHGVVLHIRQATERTSPSPTPPSATA